MSNDGALAGGPRPPSGAVLGVSFLNYIFLLVARWSFSGRSMLRTKPRRSRRRPCWCWSRRIGVCVGFEPSTLSVQIK